MLDDVRYALRLMARQKTFTAAALATLAIGIGADTALFSIVYGVMLRPLPYVGAERLVRISEEHPGAAGAVRAAVLSTHTWFAWRDAARTLEGFGAFRDHPYTVLDDAGSSRVAGADVSATVFGLLGARPAAGRLFLPGDDREGAPEIVVLSWSYWQERFGADPAIVGRTMILDGVPSTVVGVATSDFHFPDRTARLWKPFRVDRPAPGRTGIFPVLGKLRRGVTPAQAAAEGTARARTVDRPMSADLLFGTGRPVEVRVEPLVDHMAARIRPALVVMMAAVGLVLLIACANVANLLLSRGVARRRELAVRAAVGAGRLRLVRQLLTEALAIAAAGGIAGAGLAWALTRLLPWLAPADFPRLGDVRMDGAVLAFAVASTLAAGLLSGTLPAVRAGRGELLGALRHGTGASGGRQTTRLGSALLVAEATLAVMLLVGAALLARSFFVLTRVDGGYDPSNVLTARVHMASDEVPAERARAFVDTLLDGVRATPGVVAAGVGNMLPFMRTVAVGNVPVGGMGADGKPAFARVVQYVVTPGYAEALGLRVRQGRAFTASDLAAGHRALVINEQFARHLADGRPVVGRRLPNWQGVESEIVGVVADVLKDGLDAPPQPEAYYLPQHEYELSPFFIHLVVRTSGDPAHLGPQVRAIARRIDPTVAVDDVATMASRVSASVAQPRFAVAVLAGLAGTALVLAAIGLYGVLSYQVLQRRREMGVRAALGASRGSIVALVVGDGLRVTIMGVLLGLLGAAWLSRLMSGLLFGVTPHDPLAFGFAPVALILVAFAAAAVPARRAASIDPADALRSE